MTDDITGYFDGKAKSWGLTDCLSFMAMEQQSIQAALTTDEDFLQAGFRALLLEDS